MVVYLPSPRGPSTRRLPRWKRWLFGVGTAFLTFGCIEGLSWLGVVVICGQSLDSLHRQQAVIAITGTESAATDVIHPYLGWVANPQTSPGIELDGHHVPVNGLGFNDIDHGIPHRAPGRYVIAILGGSVAWQLTVLGEQAIRKRLHEDPRLRDKEIDIVRLAMSGYKQPQQLMTMTWMLSLGSSFDAVINLDGYNEITLPITENYESGVFLAYPRLWHGRMQDVVDRRVTSLSYRVLRARGVKQQLAQEMRDSFGHWSPTWNLVWMLRNESLRNELLALDAELLDHRRTEGLGFAALGPHEHFETTDELLDRSTELWSQASRQLAQICRANDIVYVHCLQPNQYVPGSKPLSNWERENIYLDFQQSAQLVAEGYPRLVTATGKLASEGIACHDLTQLFANVHESVYSDQYCHLNQLGNTLLAQAVADRLLAALPPINADGQ